MIANVSYYKMLLISNMLIGTSSYAMNNTPSQYLALTPLSNTSNFQQTPPTTSASNLMESKHPLAILTQEQRENNNYPHKIKRNHPNRHLIPSTINLPSKTIGLLDSFIISSFIRKNLGSSQTWNENFIEQIKNHRFESIRCINYNTSYTVLHPFLITCTYKNDQSPMSEEFFTTVEELEVRNNHRKIIKFTPIDSCTTCIRTTIDGIEAIECKARFYYKEPLLNCAKWRIKQENMRSSTVRI